MSLPSGDMTVAAPAAPPHPPAFWGPPAHGPDGQVLARWAVMTFFVMLSLRFVGEILLERVVIGPEWKDAPLGTWPDLLVFTWRAVSVLGATWVSCRAVGWRLEDAYLGGRRWLLRTLLGLGLGAAAFCLAILVPLAAGHERFSRTTAETGTLLRSFLVLSFTFIAGALYEEAFDRGFLLRQLERGIGRWKAAVATAALFGLMHLGNHHTSWMAIANIVLAGLLFALLVQRTGSIWLAFGFHLSWNVVQGFVWGVPVSGLLVSHSLLVRAPPGDALWTGAAFGTEASWPATAVIAALALATALWPRRSAPGNAPAP